MAQLRYWMLGAPPDRRGSAFMPGLPISAKALKWGFWGAPGQLAGYPGTKAVPAPTPPVGWQDQVTNVGGIFYSFNAPDAIWPALYYVRGKQEHAPVSLLRTNNMPVPAGDIYAGPKGASVGGTQALGLAQIAARTPRVGGQYQTGWPAAPLRWPWGNKGTRQRGWP